MATMSHATQWRIWGQTLRMYNSGWRIWERIWGQTPRYVLTCS